MNWRPPHAAGTGPWHLTYCSNVHPGESWSALRTALETHAVPLRRLCAPDRPFGLGLRLGQQAVAELEPPAARAEARAFFERHGFYVFTVNGFPYGPFHGQPVKADVYQPDWRDPARLAYTVALATLLADWLPPGGQGSLSTVPGAYRAAVTGGADRRRIAEQLVTCARALEQLEQTRGRRIVLALEPEPDCLIETTAEYIHFMQTDFAAAAGAAAAALRARVGLCLDTSHAAVVGEDLPGALRAMQTARLPVAKIQLSAGIETGGGPTAAQALAAFQDPVYLHQTALTAPDGSCRRFPDLAPALEAIAAAPPETNVRVHCHVPLTWPGAPPLRSTRDRLTPAFWRLAAATTSHFEIETYTYDVLPAPVRAAGLTQQLAADLAFLEGTVCSNTCNVS